MEKRTREIIALVLLVVLGLAVVGAMAWYIFVGHSWNQAATHIDDMVGSMDGYTVILYEGDVERPAPKMIDASGLQADSNVAPSSKSSDPSKAPAAAASSSVSNFASASSEAAASPGVLEDSPSPVSHAASPGVSPAAPTGASSDLPSAASGSAPSAPSLLRDGQGEPIPDPVEIDEVAASYEEKGAAVVLLGSDAMTRYIEPSIVKRNGMRIGILSFSGKYRLRYPQLRASVRYLQRHQVDLVVAIANDKALLRHSLEGIDLLVLMRDARIPEAGVYHGSTLCADSPYEGEVQALIVSPSGVLTSRTVREL